jgi:hypothetical protein
VQVHASGLPLWQEVPLTILGCVIPFGLIFGVLAMTKLPGERRLQHRLRPVEAAAGEDAVYGPQAVHSAAARLFAQAAHSAASVAETPGNR